MLRTLGTLQSHLNNLIANKLSRSDTSLYIYIYIYIQLIKYIIAAWGSSSAAASWGHVIF